MVIVGTRSLLYLRERRFIIICFALLCLSFFPVVMGLQNGLGRSPPMGYSSWNDCASEVHEDRIKAQATALINTGLAAKGYIHVNVDEGWFLDHNKGTMMREDPKKFPSGMKALGDWIHAQEVPGLGRALKYGLYTSRGTVQCGTALYSAEGSKGHEDSDVAFMVGAGADYLKLDSCGAPSSDHEASFEEYAQWRDALNATGRPVYFSLCGWYEWYAPLGDELGNSWRIHGDGTNWHALSEAININAKLTEYARPGAWNDPDLIQGTGRGSNDGGCFNASEVPQSHSWYQTEVQGRAQMTMWSVMSAPLLLSLDVSSLSAYQLETFGNELAIWVNQNFREGGPYQGWRVQGGDISFDRDANTGSGTNIWAKPLPDGQWGVAFLNNGDAPANLACDTACFGAMGLTEGEAATTYNVHDVWNGGGEESLVPAHGPLIAQGVEPHGGVRFVVLVPQIV